MKDFRLQAASRTPAPPAPAPEDLYSFKPSITRWWGGVGLCLVLLCMLLKMMIMIF